MTRGAQLLSPRSGGGLSKSQEHEVGILARTLFSGMCLRGYRAQHVISFCNVLLELVIEYGSEAAPLPGGAALPLAPRMPVKEALEGLAQESVHQQRKVSNGNDHE